MKCSVLDIKKGISVKGVTFLFLSPCLQELTALSKGKMM